MTNDTAANELKGMRSLEDYPNLNIADLRKAITPTNPCAGGVGEALVPHWGVWGATSPKSGFFQGTIAFQLVPFTLIQGQ
ncbi:MAG TPA: hypothetical protein V6D50_14940 [Chroococcales cyanobacterium]